MSQIIFQVKIWWVEKISRNNFFFSNFFILTFLINFAPRTEKFSKKILHPKTKKKVRIKKLHQNQRKKFWVKILVGKKIDISKKKKKNISPPPTPPARGTTSPSVARRTTQEGGSGRRRPSEADLAGTPAGERAAAQGGGSAARGGGRARGGPAAAGEAWRLQGGEGAGSRREGERGLREEGEAARAGSIERKRALPVGSVERRGKEMCEGEREGEGCGAQKGNGNRP